MADDRRIPRKSGCTPERGTRLSTAKHSWFEDAQGLVFGAAMAALGLAMLQHLGLVTGQTAGIALLLARATGVDFGPIFFLVNLPFYWLALRRMGGAFTLKTFVAVGLVSAFTLAQPHVLRFGEINPLVGAALAGMVSGAGLIALFRHGASLGGVGVLGLYLQDRFGVRAGWTQMAIDLGIFSLAFLVLDPWAVFHSLFGAMVLNAVIAINHRRDRYVAV